MTALRLLLVRHGQTPYNRDLKLQGKNDEDLTPLGISQATAAAQALKKESPAAIYSSPSKRTLQTAHFISSVHKITPITNLGLAEMNTGLLDGLTYAGIAEKFPEFAKLLESDPIKAVPPSGESLPHLHQRCWMQSVKLRKFTRKGQCYW
ncbi:MAG: histidine phosphatase family protein [Dehalococcoidia bacterium]|nr:histidine phosphatase family protein [Dehalococcoidia bacterium]